VTRVVLTIGDKVIGARALSKEKPLVIGRGKDVDLLVPNLSVSRRHAKVYHRNDTWFFEDIGSTNGSFADGQKVTVFILTEGKQVQLGRVVLKFEGGDSQEGPGPQGPYKLNMESVWKDDRSTGPIPALSPLEQERETVFIKIIPSGAQKAAAPEAGAPTAPVPHIEFAGTNPPKKVPLANGRMQIGKGDADQIRVDGLFVAAGHAYIERRQDGKWYLVAVKKFPAVSVNGLKVAEHALKFDDYIDLGSTRLWFRKGK